MQQIINSLSFNEDKISSEPGQAITRILFTITYIYILAIFYYVFDHANAQITEVIWILVGYGIFSFIYFHWVKRSNAYQSIRRHIMLFADVMLVSGSTYLLADTGFITYPIILWISIGYGLRYGPYFLTLASFLSAISYSTAMVFNGVWSQYPILVISLAIGQFLLPMLFATALSKRDKALKELQNQLKKNRYLVRYDSLTKLPNRKHIEEIITFEMANARRSESTISVAYVDIDGFSQVNDSLGHQVGDQLLIDVAKHMRKSLRNSDHLARLGGDDFLMVLKSSDSATNTIFAIERIINDVSGEYLVKGQTVFINISIGISQFPVDSNSPQELIMNAESAMYRSKKDSGSRFCLYDSAMSSSLLAELSLQNDLRQALAKEQFYLTYQPQLSLVSGKIVGAEALIRWQHPERGLIPPDQFISHAERMGIIDEIGEWVLRESIKQNATWHKMGLPPITIAINLSAHQIHSPTLADRVVDMVEEYELSPRYVELEVTEGMLLEQTEHAIKSLQKIRDTGIHLALDDFGTGYSSLAYLRRFPFTKLKIDRAFIDNVTNDPEQATIANTILAMGHSLNMSVIAEGVETEEQARYLYYQKCDEIQGYLLSKPVTAEEFTELLVDDKTPNWIHEHLSDHQKPSLLILDDDNIGLMAMTGILKKSGYNIYTATNFLDAFRIMAKHRIDVLVSDNQMPDMLGIDFLTRVKSIYPSTVRILITGMADLETAQRAVNSGAVYKFLSKSAPPDELYNTVQNAITDKRYYYNS